MDQTPDVKDAVAYLHAALANGRRQVRELLREAQMSDISFTAFEDASKALRVVETWDVKTSRHYWESGTC